MKFQHYPGSKKNVVGYTLIKLPMFRHLVWVSARKRDIEIDDIAVGEIIVYILGSGTQPKISWSDLSDENKQLLLNANATL